MRPDEHVSIFVVNTLYNYTMNMHICLWINCPEEHVGILHSNLPDTGVLIDCHDDPLDESVHLEAGESEKACAFRDVIELMIAAVWWRAVAAVWWRRAASAAAVAAAAWRWQRRRRQRPGSPRGAAGICQEISAP